MPSAPYAKRQPKDIAGQTFWVAEAYLTNESGATAFNIRFGIDVAGTPFASDGHDGDMSSPWNRLH